MEDNKDVQVTEETKTVETAKEETVKTYTQDDINNSFNAGVKKAKNELQNDGEYKKFLEWKKTNQNDSEKMAELQASNDSLKQENELLKARNKVANSDVKPEFLKFVTSEVMSLVDDTTDFDTALKNYKKNNSQYFGEVVVKRMQSSPNLVGGTKPKTTNDIMNSLIRGTRNK